LGILLVIAPIGGPLVLTLWIGAYALAFGITLVCWGSACAGKLAPN
jgi:uncharacterized membrane protein HdeD (DUF308 family)